MGLGSGDRSLTKTTSLALWQVWSRDMAMAGSNWLGAQREHAAVAHGMASREESPWYFPPGPVELATTARQSPQLATKRTLSGAMLV